MVDDFFKVILIVCNLKMNILIHLKLSKIEVGFQKPSVLKIEL